MGYFFQLVSFNYRPFVSHAKSNSNALKLNIWGKNEFLSSEKDIAKMIVLNSEKIQTLSHTKNNFKKTWKIIFSRCFSFPKNHFPNHGTHCKQSYFVESLSIFLVGTLGKFLTNLNKWKNVLRDYAFILNHYRLLWHPTMKGEFRQNWLNCSALMTVDSWYWYAHRQK